MLYSLRNMMVAVLATSLASAGLAQTQRGENEQDRSQLHNDPTAQRLDSDTRLGNERERTTRDGNHSDTFSKLLACKLMLANHTTIELSELAQQKASSPGVKQFARTLIEEHQQINQNLKQEFPEVARMQQQWMQEHGATTGRSIGSEGSRQNSERTRGLDLESNSGRLLEKNDSPTRRTKEPRNQTRSSREHMQGDLEQKIMKVVFKASQKHLEMSKEMLNEYQGQDFDMGFLGLQIAGHAWLIAELEATSEVASGQIAQVSENALQKVKRHFRQAKELSKQLEDKEGGARRTSRRIQPDQR